MQATIKREGRLLSSRAFVVQFRANATIGQSPCPGRVEHVVSGQATVFQSVEEMLAFMARILTTLAAQPRGQPKTS